MKNAPTRRAVLLSAAAIAAGAAGGGAYAAIRPEPATGRASAPPDLAAAAQAESRLLALIDAAVTAHGLAGTLAGVRADHQAHAAALQAEIASYPGSRTPEPYNPPPAVAPTPAAALAQIRGAEQQAAIDAAARARTLAGPAATVLASISACEATHAALLS